MPQESVATPFEPEKFLADPTVAAMPPDAVNAYVFLLCHARAADPAGTIPADDSALSRISRLSPSRWAEVASAVLAAFERDRDGRYHHRGLQELLAKEEEAIQAKDRLSVIRSAAGRKGGQRKAENRKESASKPSKIVANATNSSKITSKSSKISSKTREKASKPVAKTWQKSSKATSYSYSSLSSPDSSKSHPTSRRAGGMNSPRPPSCSESEKPTPELPFPDPGEEPPPKEQVQPPPAVMTFPVVGKDPGEWHLTAAKVAEWREAFPGIDVTAECRKARQWCLDNPRRCKTRRGITAFLGRWLSKAQDGLGRNPGGRPGSAEDDDGWSDPATSPDPNVGVPLTPERIRQIERDLAELEAGRGLK
jgi:uncharacterized protein YdaU (DUF1376 family)